MADEQDRIRKQRELEREQARRARMAELKAERERKAEELARERASSDPMKDPTNRPEAPPDDIENIYYYSWIGGATSGQWKLYKQPKSGASADQIANAERRSVGGATNATYSSSAGANAVPSANTPSVDLTPPDVIGPFRRNPVTGEYERDDGSEAVGGGGADPRAASLTLGQQRLEQQRQREERKSAYDLLFQQFDQYGLGALVTPLKGLIEEGISPSEFTIRLRETDAYKKRFAANEQRIKAGLRALSEAEYIGLEDQYQNVMRNYGLPASYYQRGDMGVQPGFEKFLAGDVSAAELEDRIQTAQNRVINAAPEVSKALRQFYPDITNGDILAYALDPQQALTNIKRKVQAAEIGAGAMQAGFAAGLARAEELQKYGVTGEQARAGYQTIAEFLPTAQKLSDIYAKQGLGGYGQTAAEQEVFGITGAADAATRRKKLAQLETAAFSGQAGAAGGALGRERAGQF